MRPSEAQVFEAGMGTWGVRASAQRPAAEVRTEVAECGGTERHQAALRLLGPSWEVGKCGNREDVIRLQVGNRAREVGRCTRETWLIVTLERPLEMSLKMRSAIRRDPFQLTMSLQPAPCRPAPAYLTQQRL
jgi:hypothetical protein